MDLDVLLPLLATRSGYPSGWAYANAKTQREFVQDFRAWYSTFMVPFRIVVEAFTGGDDDKPSDQPDGVPHKGPSPRSLETRRKATRKGIPKGASVFDMGGKDEFPNPGALLALRSGFGKGGEHMSRQKMAEMFADYERGNETLARQKSTWETTRRG